MSALDAATDTLESTALAHLGDAITYSLAGGPAVAMDAWVTFDTAQVVTAGSAGIADALEIEIPMTVGKPSSADRVTIARIPGRIYSPVGSPERGAMGNSWRVALKRVAA